MRPRENDCLWRSKRNVYARKDNVSAGEDNVYVSKDNNENN